jgi:signal transduction histidine kinase/FixJ family two-component response regulator
LTSLAPRILVVDDEPVNRRLLDVLLTPEFGRPIHAGDGQAALDAFAAAPFDLVVADVMMPGVDGLELCRRLRADPAGAFVPIILVTALADATSRANGKIAGADDFLTKPIIEEELLARARNLLRLRAYQLELDRQRRQAEQDAERWRLASEVAGSVVRWRSYDRLLQDLWELLEGPLGLACAGVLTGTDGAPLRLSALCGVAGSAPAGAMPTTSAELAGAWVPERWASGGAAPRAQLVRVDEPDDSVVHAMVREHDLAEAFVVPVEGAGAVHGLLTLGRRTAASADVHQLVAMLAPHLSNAINNIRLHLHAERLLRARDELTQLVIHDLRGPLANAQLNQRCALELATEPDLIDALRDAASATDRAVALVSDLLDAAAAEDERLRLARAPIDLGALLADVARSSRVRRGAAIDTAVTSMILDVDRRLLQRVLENLLDNALRHCPPTGRVRLALRRDGSDAVVSVHNDGPPLPASARARLFEKYAGTVDDPRSRGLGLYFCRLVVESHGGTIDATTPATGVEFELRLPGGVPSAPAR